MSNFIQFEDNIINVNNIWYVTPVFNWGKGTTVGFHIHRTTNEHIAIMLYKKDGETEDEIMKRINDKYKRLVDMLNEC